MTVLMTPQVESGLLHGEDSQTNRGLTTPRIGLAQVDKSGSCRAETANAVISRRLDRCRCHSPFGCSLNESLLEQSARAAAGASALFVLLSSLSLALSPASSDPRLHISGSSARARVLHAKG